MSISAMPSTLSPVPRAGGPYQPADDTTGSSPAPPVSPVTLGGSSMTALVSDVADALAAFIHWIGHLFSHSAGTPANPGGNPQVPVPDPVAAPTPASNPPIPAASGAPSSSSASGPVGVPGNWQLVFDDEFNNPEQWGKTWSNMWGDHWTMNNVVTNPENVKIENGAAQLTLASSSSGALMTTNSAEGGGGFMMGYGYAEARVKLPVSNGQLVGWPAWWISGDNWPANGEADIVEGLGGQATSNYHSNNGADNSGPIPGTWTDGGWHTFGIDREPGENRIYWDGKLVRTYSTHDNGAPEALLLNFGSGGGPQVDGATMQVDYVRVWQRQQG